MRSFATCIAIISLVTVASACGGMEELEQIEQIDSTGQAIYTPTSPVWQTPRPDIRDDGPTGPGSTPLDPGAGKPRPPISAEPYCGDGYCGNGENCRTCSRDCGSCCGNGTCDNGETWATCPGDCPTCGNGTLDPGEQCDGIPTNTSCAAAATYKTPSCSSAQVGCKSCRFDLSECPMWWSQLQVCVDCGSMGNCFDSSKGLWSCRESDGSCDAYTGVF